MPFYAICVRRWVLLIWSCHLLIYSNSRQGWVFAYCIGKGFQSKSSTSGAWHSPRFKANVNLFSASSGHKNYFWNIPANCVTNCFWSRTIREWESSRKKDEEKQQCLCIKIHLWINTIYKDIWGWNMIHHQLKSNLHLNWSFIWITALTNWLWRA